MTTVTLILVATSLPMCFAITHASRAGAKGFAPFLVWCMESSAARLLAVANASARMLLAGARWIRDFHEWSRARRVA